MKPFYSGMICFFCLFLPACDRQTQPAEKPAGSQESPRTDMLEAGAKLMQGNAPVSKLDIHLIGFHPMKKNPAHQMEAHHFCKQQNEDLAQCVLYDGSSADSNLTGIEYIISEKLYQQLPTAEKAYWHPHNYEILSGQLVAPGLPVSAELELMKSKMNSYGKTWHLWNTGQHHVQDAQNLPMGEPMLAWSFNHDGEADQGLINQSAARLNISFEKKRAERRNLTELARPQGGVEALKDNFKNKLEPLPGVKDSQVSKDPAN